MVNMTIEGNHFPVEVNIGNRFPLFLASNELATLNKKYSHSTEWRNIHGHVHESPTYIIPKIKIGELTLYNIEAIGREAEPLAEVNTLGKFFGENFNLLLDFPHSQIVICNTFLELQSKKLVEDNWIQVPFELGRLGIILNVDTDKGIKRLALSTTTTATVLKSPLPEGVSSIFSSRFTIGGEEFGKTELHYFEIAPILTEVDGFIGMDFLQKHPIYIDNVHKCVYIQPEPRYFTKIPIDFRSGIPYITAHIENKAHSLKVNLGGDLLLTLHEQILNSLDKEKYGTYSWCDFSGERYHSPTYIIPKLDINELSLKNVLVNQDSELFHKNITFGKETFTEPGSIGRGLLEKFNLFLDFSNSAIYACNYFSQLQPLNIFEKKAQKIPFKLHRDGILLEIDTDYGQKKVILDTGASHTVLKSSLFNLSMKKEEISPQLHYVISAKFSIQGIHFGETTIVLIPLCPECDFDGYLGMDFLKDKQIYIDYPKKELYFCR